MLTWSDEFDGPVGSPPDSQWSAQVNGAGGGNAEREYYIPEASSLDGNSNLIIAANRDPGTYQAWYGKSEYTSGKVWTRGRVAFRYGHLEVRAAFPCAGEGGAWPAIWMLGADYSNVGWPDCGEIDIFESFGTDLSKTEISAAIHSGAGSKAQRSQLPPDNDATKFHIYTLDWRQGSLQLGVDGETKLEAKSTDFPAWPFDKPFFLILNLAIGGTMGGTVPASATFPYVAQFDYARLYGGEVYESNGLVG